MVKELILGKGEKCLVDDEDYEKLSKLRWNKSQYGYAYRLGDRNKGEKYKVLMHREIMNAQEGQIVDHKNRKKLDNRRSNLRFVTKAQNTINCDRKNTSSGFRGVSKNTSSSKDSWRALIRFNRKHIHLGCFTSPEDAARAYNEAAKRIHGEFAVLNDV